MNTRWVAAWKSAFNPLEFEGVRTEASLNVFTLSPMKWIETTNAIGLITQSERLVKLNHIAIHQMSVLENDGNDRKLELER